MRKVNYNSIRQWIRSLLIGALTILFPFGAVCPFNIKAALILQGCSLAGWILFGILVGEGCWGVKVAIVSIAVIYGAIGIIGFLISLTSSKRFGWKSSLAMLVAIYVGCKLYLAFVAVMLDQGFGINYGKGSGVSMEPTIGAGDIFISRRIRENELASRFKGAIVLVEFSEDEVASLKGKKLVKRVTAVEGDAIFDDSKSERMYTAKDSVPEGTQRLVLPEGYLFVEGDNPSQSFDSRIFGPVEFSSVRMEILFIVNSWKCPKDFVK